MADSENGQKTYAQDYIKSDTDRAVIMGSAVADNLMTGLMALSAEVWSIRRRQKIVESLLAKHGSVTHAMIEEYVPSPAETAAWTGERDAFVKLVFDSFSRTADIPYSSSLKFDFKREP
jgi:hypothetical protein